MFSKVLIKLVDQAIVPALLLLTARVVSVVLLANYFNVTLSIGSSGFVFENQETYILINSYSILLMVAALSVGLLYILLKSYIFHDTHISPHHTARLFTLRLSSFIQTSFDLYSQGAVWMSYLFLMVLVAGLMAFFGLIYSWVFVISLILFVITTVLFVFDIENEVSLHPGKISEDSITSNMSNKLKDEYVLKFGGDDV